MIEKIRAGTKMPPNLPTIRSLPRLADRFFRFLLSTRQDEEPRNSRYGFQIFDEPVWLTIIDNGKKPLVLNPGNQTQYIVLNGDAVNL